MTDWDVGKLLEVSGSYWHACTLHAGVKLDLFSRIEAGDNTAEDIAGCLGCDVRVAAVLLDALAAMGLIVKAKCRYSNTPASKSLLVKGSPQYIGYMIIERCFRSLKKTQIKMTPMYHWGPRRIETHVRLCVLALLIERVAELSCNKPWSQIREALDRLQVTKFENSSHRFFHRNELDPETSKILKSLKIKTPKQVLEIEKTP